MAVSPFIFYNSGRLKIFDGTMLWNTSGDISAFLCNADYAPLPTHTQYSDLTGHVEQSEATGYLPKALTGRVVSTYGSSVLYTSNMVDYGSNVSIVARYLVLVYCSPLTPVDTDLLIGYVDFGSLKQSIASDFSFTPDSNIWFSVEELATF